MSKQQPLERGRVAGSDRIECHGYQTPTEVIDYPFEEFIRERVDGDVLSVGFDGRPPIALGDSVGSQELVKVDQDEHDHYSTYLSATAKENYSAVVADFPPEDHFSRSGGVLACEEVVSRGGVLIVRTRGKTIPGWVKLDMNETAITEFGIDLPPQEWEDALPVAVYTKQQADLGAWA